MFSKFDELLSRFEFSMCWFCILKGIPGAVSLGFRGLGFMVEECFAGFLLKRCWDGKVAHSCCAMSGLRFQDLYGNFRELGTLT